jgi:hypothetical protein
MNPKAIIQRIASRFETVAGTIETRIVIDATALEHVIPEALQRVEIIREETMSTPTAGAEAAASAGRNVNTAVQIALSLKAIDASLPVEAMQAATNAALAAAYSTT